MAAKGRLWLGALAGAMLATGLLAAAPSGLGGSWRAADAASLYLLSPWPVFALLVFVASVAKQDQDGLRAFGFPVLAATPALLLKLDLAAPNGWLVPQVVLSLGLVAMAGRAIERPQMAATLALVGLLAVGWAARAELLRREAEVANGRVELLLRELAEAVGNDTAQHGPPPTDSRVWLERLRLSGWQVADNGDWYWAPDERLAPGAVRLRYSAPDATASAWAVVLRAVPQPMIGRDSRPFEAEITLDGAITWSWPNGPPPAVAAREAAAE